MAWKPKGGGNPKRNPVTAVTSAAGVLSVVAWLAWSVPWLWLFVAAGLMPAFAAYVADTSREKNDVVAVGTLSASAMLPFLLDGLAQAGHSAGRDILGSPFAWLSVYAAAAFAYALSWVFPISLNTIYEARASARLRDLLRRQQTLVAEWGEKVREEFPGRGGA
ncbi:MAG: hypothetical protein JNN22_02725 [Rhodospirillales bacterium]|nr:hypothetical protein [Rhodospirillales bacterium]